MDLLDAGHMEQHPFDVSLSTETTSQREEQLATEQKALEHSRARAVISQSVSAKPCSMEEKSLMNAMGAFLSLKSRPQTPKGLVYGQSSIASLQQQVLWDSPRLANPRTLAGRPSRQGVYEKTTAARSGTSLNDLRRFSLPARALADHLLDSCYGMVHLFYPWFHYPTFDAAYKDLWLGTSADNSNAELPRVGLGGRDCPEELFHCALNTIFALGCEFSPSVPLGDAQPVYEFMGKVYELLQIKLLDNGLAAIQTLLLVTIYLQSTQYLMRCWGIAGLALRMAQGMGLDLDANNSGYTVLEVEMRRRAWHGCVLMDR
ncbi:hypothetical protein LTR84_003576 [Exophiala bonariae]|uniref:Xylanolytic transcriptional activator regulatory domain-containing protein n=1 Tax=Exophiala bonariae TaxID=1690606 RepID=A0AAV9NB28_9EURO|nr:hypothetical protein LTR84_003576 [Exophiala bonariae]